MKFTLTENHINFILNDIESRGVKMESLQQSLLDHICCILEDEITEEKEFEREYDSIVKRFFKEDLSEIEKETKQLLRNKYYYQMKKFLYIILFVSVGFNLLFIGHEVFSYFLFKKEMRETTIVPALSLKDAMPEFIAKIKADYPEKDIKKKIYVGFFNNSSYLESEESLKATAETIDITIDSLKNQRKKQQDEYFLRTDSLAATHPNVTFVIGFLRTGNDVEEIIDEYKQKSKHLLFADGLIKLYSGYKNTSANRKARSVSFFPNNIVITDDGELLYYPKKFGFLRSKET